MKKLYIKPQIEASAINVCQIVCKSLEYGEKASTNGIRSADARSRGNDDDFDDLW